jgi:murein DD-endopeptidase MepM/ murein hydrolase activator NlpD
MKAIAAAWPSWKRAWPAWKRELRTFGAGAGCGFLAGVLLVSTLVWQAGGLRATAVGRYDPPRGDHRAPGPVDDAGGGVIEPAAESTHAMGRGRPPSPTGTRTVIGPDPTNAKELADRDLLIPVEGVGREQLTRQFSDSRGVSRQHEAIDITAPRHTPVRAVEDGTIARLFQSKAGGTTIYQFDPSSAFCYYYAHLERYADGLQEGQQVRKGQVIGYVGTTGNASPNTPHLHFAIFRLTAAKRWWEGTAIDPYDVFR